MHSIRRSGHSALQSINATYPITHISRRAFSRSAAFQRGTLPVFLPASTPDLSALLSTTQTKILLPLHLNPAQSKLVFRTENAAKLASEPIEITLGDVTLPLSHINRNKDVPDRSKTLRAIIAKSTTQADWENVLRVMEGYENAGVRMKTGWQEQVVRKLGQAGCQHLVVKALKRAADTGLRLREWGVIREVIRGVRDKAAGAEWAQEDLKKAVNMAEQVVEMMEEDEHLGKAVGAADHRSNPMVVALPLEMAAELAYRHDGDVERVKKYAQRLMTALKQHDFLSTEIQNLNAVARLRETDFPRPIDQSRGSGELAKLAYEKISLWNGLSTARTVLDDAMPMAEDAERVQKELYAALKAAEEGLQALCTRNGEAFKRADEGLNAYVSEAIRQFEDEE